LSLCENVELLHDVCFVMHPVAVAVNVDAINLSDNIHDGP